MHEALAYSTMAMTLGLVVTRPRVGAGELRIGPAHAAGAGVAILLLTGVLGLGDLPRLLLTMWQPLLTIAAIMVTTGVAHATGVLSWLADAIEQGPSRATPLAGARNGRQRTRGSATRLFDRVFWLCALTAAVLNNDAAVLLLTPVVVVLVRQRYPHQPGVVVAFAFAVFVAAGVAPLVVSNPMNMIVASFAGIGFNEYALTMTPVWLLGALLAHAGLRLCFRAALASALPSPAARAVRRPLSSQQAAILVLIGVLLAAYPLISLWGGPIWLVATIGASAALGLAPRGAGGAWVVARRSVSLEVLLFLLAVVALGVGLRNVGLVDRLASFYDGASVWTVGASSALGSAVLNNHPMTMINVLALDGLPGSGHSEALAVLVGGDLGPRLLPIGSLAGLLWLDSLRRLQVEVPLRRFVVVGLCTTLPALAVSLTLLSLA